MEITNNNELELEEQKPIMPQQKLTPIFMALPYEVRTHIYSYLRQLDFLRIRQVCEHLRFETDNYARYNIVFKFRLKYNGEYFTGGYPIPFPHLNSLEIYNDEEELPWGDCENDTVKILILRRVKSKTFRTLGQIRTVQEAKLGSEIFSNTIPALNWNLRKLQIYLSASNEKLEYLDSLLIQNIGNLEELIVQAWDNLENPTMVQRPLALRILRLIIKHSKTLKNVNLFMHFHPCVPRNYVANPEETSELSNQEILSLKEIQLDTLSLHLAEVICPLCYNWQNFIRQQKNLKSLMLRIYHAVSHPSFFFWSSNFASFQSLQELSIYLEDMDGYVPLDCDFLSGAVNLRYLQIRRNTPPHFQTSEREILNIESLPQGLIHVYFSGLLLFSDQVPDLFLHLRNMKRFVCVNCGTGVDIGFNTGHIYLIQEHEHLTDLVVDFNCPGVEHKEATAQIKNALTTINIEYKAKSVRNSEEKHRFAIWVCKKYRNTRAEVLMALRLLYHVYCQVYCYDAWNLLSDHDRSLFISR